MRIPCILVATLCAFSASAQRSFIGSPAPGASVRNGRTFTVQLIRPNSIQGSQEVGLAIALLPCQTVPCPPPNEQLGRVLFIGKYNPQLHEQPGRPYQNFTVTVPSSDSFPKGVAQLSTARLHLIGAGPSPTLELNNITLNVV